MAEALEAEERRLFTEERREEVEVFPGILNTRWTHVTKGEGWRKRRWSGGSPRRIGGDQEWGGEEEERMSEGEEEWMVVPGKPRQE